MTAPQQKRRPADGTAEAANRNANAEPDYGPEDGKASDQKSDGFAAFRGRWIECGLRDHGLSDGAFRVLASLAYDFLHRKKRTAWPAQDTLAEAVGMPVRTVQRHVAELKSRGHLRTDQRGRDKSNIYHPAFCDAPKMAGHDEPMTRQKLRDDPPNPATKTRHRRRTTLLKDPVDDHRRAQSAPAVGNQSDQCRDAHLTGASTDPVVLLEIGQSIDHDHFGSCEIVDISRPFPDTMGGHEYLFKGIRLRSHRGLDLTFAALISKGADHPLWKTLKRFDELTPARLRQLGWRAGPMESAGTSRRKFDAA